MHEHESAHSAHDNPDTVTGHSARAKIIEKQEFPQLILETHEPSQKEDSEPVLSDKDIDNTIEDEKKDTPSNEDLEEHSSDDDSDINQIQEQEDEEELDHQVIEQNNDDTRDQDADESDASTDENDEQTSGDMHSQVYEHTQNETTDTVDEENEDDEYEEDKDVGDENVPPRNRERLPHPLSIETRRNLVFFLMFALMMLAMASQSESNTTAYDTSFNTAYRPPVPAQNIQTVQQTAYGITTDGLRFQFPEVAQIALQYENVYFREQEFELNPRRIISRANNWLAGEHANPLGCFGDQPNGDALEVATWFYPCGTVLEVVNELTGQSVYATVTDRGPNRGVNSLSYIPGYENDAIRNYGFDVTPGVSRTIGHLSGGVLTFIPRAIPNVNVTTLPIEVIDLTQSPQEYVAINPTTGQFMTNEVALAVNR